MSHKVISDRVQFWKSADSLRVEITQQAGQLQETLLFVWLTAWTFCGASFAIYFFYSNDKAEQIFMAVLFGMWAIFEFRIGRVFFWRKIGREVIEVNSDNLSIRNKIGRFGRTQRFNIQHVMHFGRVTHKANSFWAFMDNSYWIMGGDTLNFKFMGKEFQLGKQLNDKECQALNHLMAKSVREFAKKSSQEAELEESRN